MSAPDMPSVFEGVPSVDFFSTIEHHPNAYKRQAQDRDQLEITDKARNDFVTSADKAAEAAIVRELMEAYPQHGILTEEAGRLGPKSDFLWIIDPIDGTTNFIHGLPQYAVSIALTYCGEPIAAVVYDVAKNELFTAAKGQGAKLDSRRHGVPVPSGR